MDGNWASRLLQGKVDSGVGKEVERLEVKLHGSAGEMKRNGRKGGENKVQGKNFWGILGVSHSSGT